MTDRPSKVWEPYSKMVRMQEEDWAVLESVYNDYRYRQGDLQRTEFVKRLVAKGVTSYLYQLKSRTPEALLKIAQASSALGTSPFIHPGPGVPDRQDFSHYQRNQTKREKVRLKSVSDGRAVLPRQEPEIDEGNVPD